MLQQSKKLKPILQDLLSYHQSLLIGCCTMLFCSFIPVNRSNYQQGTANFQYLQLAATLFFLVGNFAVNKLFKSALIVIQVVNTVDAKLIPYKKATMQKFIITSVALFVIGMGYFLTQHWTFLVLFFIQAMVLFSQRPHPMVVSVHLNVTKESLYQ